MTKNLRRWRPALLILGLPLLILAAGWAWQRASLARIPDVGDPFDLEAFERDFPDDLPDEENAFTFYKLACGEFPGIRNFRRLNPAEDWAFADDEWKARLDEARPALERWREGTARDEALYHRIAEMNVSTLLPVTQELRSTFAPLALLEGSRREAEGDMAGAWAWYRALLRCSRHSGRNGFLIERLVGSAIFDKAEPRIRRWAADDRVTAEELRAALADVRTADALTADDVQFARLEYWMSVRAIDDPKQFAELIQFSRQGQGTRRPPGGNGQWLATLDLAEHLAWARVRSGYEGERCRRLTRLLWANRLPQLARPPEDRAKLASEHPAVYDDDPTAPASARALPAPTLAALAQAAPLGLVPKDFFGNWLGRFEKERVTRARLIVDLASRLYRLDRGEPPPAPDALITDYLDRLPDGFAPEGTDDRRPAIP